MKIIFKLGDIMNKRENYSTKQKEKILNVIKSKEKEFTVKDIYNELKEEVGLTTIYRLIEKLLEENRISKSIGKDNTTYYQFLEECSNENHFYLKCIECKTLTHVDCDCIEELTNHILKKHNFKLTKENIIIKGICNKCKK